MCIDAYNDKSTEEYQRLIRVAWHVGAFTRVDRLPDLDTLFLKKETSQDGLRQGLIAMAEAHNARIAGAPDG